MWRMVYIDKIGDVLKLISQRLSEDAINQKLVIQSAPNTFDLLERINEEWDRINVIDEKEYKDVEMRLEGMKDIRIDG